MKNAFLFILLIGFFLTRPSFADAYVYFDTPSAPYPQVNFSFSPNPPQLNNSTQFTNSSTCYSGVDGAGNPIVGSCASWQWSFGDGGSSVAKDPSYTYFAAGSYNVTLFAISGSGDVCSYSAVANAGSGGVGGPTPSSRITIYKEVSPK